MGQLSALLALPAYLSLSPKFRWAMKMLPCIFLCPMKSDSMLQKENGGEGNGQLMGEWNREQNARKTSPIKILQMINGKGGFSKQCQSSAFIPSVASSVLCS